MKQTKHVVWNERQNSIVFHLAPISKWLSLPGSRKRRWACRRRSTWRSPDNREWSTILNSDRTWILTPVGDPSKRAPFSAANRCLLRWRRPWRRQWAGKPCSHTPPPVHCYIFTLYIPFDYWSGIILDQCKDQFNDSNIDYYLILIQGDWLVTLPLFLRKSKTLFLFVVEYSDWSHFKDNSLIVIVLEFHWSRKIIS